MKIFLDNDVVDIDNELAAIRYNEFIMNENI